MKTTLSIPEPVMAKLRREAARRGCTISELVESALRLLLGGARQGQAAPPAPPLPSFPSWRSGGALVDIADRDALYRAMEGR